MQRRGKGNTYGRSRAHIHPLAGWLRTGLLRAPPVSPPWGWAGVLRCVPWCLASGEGARRRDGPHAREGQGACRDGHHGRRRGACRPGGGRARGKARRIGHLRRRTDLPPRGQAHTERAPHRDYRSSKTHRDCWLEHLHRRMLGAHRDNRLCWAKGRGRPQLRPGCAAEEQRSRQEVDGHQCCDGR